MSRIVNPLGVFLFVWLICLSIYSLKISWFLNPAEFILWYAFGLSLISFITGYASAYILIFLFNGHYSNKYDFVFLIDQKRLSLFLWGLFMMSVLIVLFNIAIQGLPPMFGFFGVDTEIYKGYGRLKGFLYPLLTSIALLSLLSKSKKVKFFFINWAIIVFLLYVTRGNIIILTVQLLLMLLITNKIQLKNIFVYLISFLIFLVVLMSVVGELRTGTKVFMLVMEIKSEYETIYPGLLWVGTYISQPFSDLLYIIQNLKKPFLGEMQVNLLLPSFMNHVDELKAVLENIPNVRDNAHTYLGVVYADFLWVGVVIINLLLGAVGGLFFFTKIGVNFYPLFAIYLSQLVLLQFSYFYLTFSFLIENLILFVAVSMIFRKKWRTVKMPNKINFIYSR